MDAFSYLRVSDKSQVEGDGFPRQRDAINREAKRAGITIIGEFAEEGVTGEADWSKRPAFQRMIGAVLDGEVRAVVVENLTRLARAFVIQDSIIVFLASKGITLISADTGEDVTAAFQGDPMKRAIIQMQAVFSELEKNNLVRKLRAAKERVRAETGRCEGRKPFGHFPGEETTIQRMRALRRKPKGGKAWSFARVAAALTEEGCASRGGGAWTAESVRKILGRKQP